MRPFLFFVISLFMNPDMQYLAQGAKLLGLELSAAQLESFYLYQRELLLWNAKTNLIAESTENEIIPRHFLDSLTACRYIIKQNARIVDIGTGAGFPGLPLKIALPSLQLYLVESNRKKISFLKHLIRLLKLPDVFTLNERTENILKSDVYREKFDIVISRASLKLPELLSLSDYFLAPEGLLITLKGPGVDEELSAVENDKNGTIFSLINQYDINIPLLGPPRKIICVQKPKIN